MENLHLRAFAHIGDAVYEVFIRELVIYKTNNSKKMHDFTTSFVNANFQASLLENMMSFLSEEEENIIKRAKNLPVTVSKRSNQTIHKVATCFEVLLGYNYINNKKRYKELLDIILPFIKFC